MTDRRFRVNRRRFALIGLGLGMAGRIPVNAQESTELTDSAAANLPAVDLPSMNEQGHSFAVSSTFTGSFTTVPETAPIYTMSYDDVTAESISERAGKLGLEGEVTEIGANTYSMQTDMGSIYATRGQIQYISSAANDDGDLPDDAGAQAAAREWLRTQSLLPANVGDGRVITRVDDAARVIVIFQPKDPSPLISATPNMTVVVGRNGAVLEYTDSWANLAPGDVYQLRGGESAWAEVESRRAWLDATLPTDQFEPGTVVGGSVAYTGVTLAYSSSGIPGQVQYLQPVYVFAGNLTADGVDGSFPVNSYVPALISANQPVG